MRLEGKWRRVALWAAAGAALALVACWVALKLMVDPERLRKAARDRALAAWERELLLGDVTVDLFPVPSLRAAKVSFANPPWAREPHLLQAEFVRADLELLPLLVGKLRIKRLALDGVKAGLEISEDGTASWELRTVKPAPGARDAAEPGSPDAPDVLHIAALHLTNARITLRDREGAASPWKVEEATIESAPGQKDVVIDAHLTRHDRPMRIEARFADLSALGTEGAATEGRVRAEWGSVRLEAEGTFPLARAMKGLALEARVQGESLEPVFAFFGIERGRSAPLAARLRAKERDGRIAIEAIEAKLGALRVTGEAKVRLEPVSIEAKLAAGRLDWLQTLRDAGGVIKPPRKSEEVFHPDPVAWRVVSSLGALDGHADLAIASLKLGNGIELGNVRTRAEFGKSRLAFSPFRAEMLGGAAEGALELDGAKKSLRFRLDGDKLLLERWFRERGTKIPFKGGPMRVKADLALSGATYRELAASTSGRLSIRMGEATWKSERAGELEEMMVRALAPKDGSAISFHCGAADLEFKSGRASGKHLVGARSDVSQLLTSGHVDLREETLDLRGRLLPRSGPRIGVSSFLGEVQIAGRVARPRMQLDPDAKPAIVARAGAAIASSGLTILGSALLDAAAAKEDPCEVVLK